MREEVFYVRVALHRNKFLFNKTNRRTNFPNLFLSRNSTRFGRFLCPPSGLFHCTFGTGIRHAGLMTTFKHELDETSSILAMLESCHQTCMIYARAECAVEKSWWWAEDLPETCRVSWQNEFCEISVSVGFIKKREEVLLHGFRWAALKGTWAFQHTFVIPVWVLFELPTFLAHASCVMKNVVHIITRACYLDSADIVIVAFSVVLYDFNM